MSTQEIALAHPASAVAVSDGRIAEVLALRKRVVDMMRQGMQDGLDYGPPFPGSDKPTLLQPGADKICAMLQIRPEYKMEQEVLEKDFIYYRVSCELVYTPSGVTVGQAFAVCNSREEKYGYRKAKRKCPVCGKETVIKGKEEYGGGWLCWLKPGKSDGCGAKWPDGAKEIEEQIEGKIPVENVWEQANTMLQMAQKRAKVSAVKTVATISDIFTVPDVDDMREFAGYETESEPQPLHREGNKHLSTLCQVCIDAGVQEGFSAVLSGGHIYLTKQDSKVPLTHDFTHKCHFYCPPCRADFLNPRKTSDAERAKLPPLPAAPSPHPNDTAAAPAGATPEPSLGALEPSASAPLFQASAAIPLERGQQTAADKGPKPPAGIATAPERIQFLKDMIALVGLFGQQAYQDALGRAGFTSLDEVPQKELGRVYEAVKRDLEANRPVAKAAPSEPPANAISQAQVKRLYAIAKGNGWGEAQIEKLLHDRGYLSASHISKGKHYELICKELGISPPQSFSQEDDQGGEFIDADIPF